MREKRRRPAVRTGRAAEMTNNRVAGAATIIPDTTKLHQTPTLPASGMLHARELVMELATDCCTQIAADPQADFASLCIANRIAIAALLLEMAALEQCLKESEQNVWQ